MIENDVDIDDGDLRPDSDAPSEQSDDENAEAEPTAEEPLFWNPNYVPTLIPMYEGPSRGPKTIPLDVDSPYAWFNICFPTQPVLHSIVVQTNLYHMQYQQHLPPGKMAPDWVHLNIAELKKFIGIAIVNGLHRAPRINLLWSNSPVFHNPLVASAMTYKRVETILRFLHLSNNERGQPTDTIWKVRPLLDTLNHWQIFHSN